MLTATLIMLCISCWLALSVLVQEPLSDLEGADPTEYRRLGGLSAPVGWHCYSFIIYLALGEFKSNVSSEYVVNKFVAPMWLARLTIFIGVAAVFSWFQT